MRKGGRCIFVINVIYIHVHQYLRDIQTVRISITKHNSPIQARIIVTLCSVTDAELHKLVLHTQNSISSHSLAEPNDLHLGS